MTTDKSAPAGASPAGDADPRLLVLEMTIAAVAARLPQADFDEVVSMLVFVAKSSDAARALDEPPGGAQQLAEAGRCATAMLDRIAASRRAQRGAAGN